MLKRIFKKIGLSLLFAGVLSVGLSINSASAITEYQKAFLETVQEVVKGKGDDYTYNAKGFWQEVADAFSLKLSIGCWAKSSKKLGSKEGDTLHTAYSLFSRILNEKGISLENKGVCWTIIFKPYKDSDEKDLMNYIENKIAKDSKYQINDDRIKRCSWTNEENEALYKIVEDYLKNLEGNPLPYGAWNKISVMCKGNEILKKRKINNNKIRSHFCKTNFKERGKLIESSKRMTAVLNGFSKYISGNPQNPLSLKAYIKNVNSGEIELPAALSGVSETHTDPGYEDQEIVQTLYGLWEKNRSAE